MKQKDLVYILSSSFILTVLWIAFGLWHIYTTSTIKAPLSTQLVQIPATFDTETISLIKARTIVSPIMQFGEGSVASSSSELAPIIAEIPVLTPTPSIVTDIPVSSGSGSTSL